MLPTLQAEHQLAAIEAASVPHMNKDSHRQTVARLFDRLGGRKPKAAPARLDDLAALGIQVEQVKEGE